MTIALVSLPLKHSTISHSNEFAQGAASTATPNSISALSTVITHMPSQAETWFLSFALFVYDPTASIESNFDRLSSQRQWGEKLRRKQWTNCQAASAALSHANTNDDAHAQTPSQAGTWFQKFPPFVYDPIAGIRSNFKRLAAQRNWVGKSASKRWAECQAEEFDYAYGTDTTKLEIWKNLCHEVHISDPPDSINQCKKVNESQAVETLLLTAYRCLVAGTSWSIWSIS
jgi:hypothetical protein